MQVISPEQRQQLGGGARPRPFLGCEQVPAWTDMPLPLFSPPAHARIFADTVTARELWPA